MSAESNNSTTKMTASSSSSVTWEDIELSESYLVSGMFEEAATLASSILTRINENKCDSTESEGQWLDMKESAAMVLVQSWGESGRTSDLLNELEIYYGSVSSIPFQVVLTSACVQVSGGFSSGVRIFLEEFLSKWRYDSDKYYVDQHSLELDQYLEVVEFYALTLLGGVLNDVDHASSWVEKAQLPEEARQDLLRRLSSLSSVKSTSSVQGSVSSSMPEEPESQPLSVKEVKQSDKPLTALSTQYHNGVNNVKHSVWEWLRNITKRSGNAVLTSNGKILFSCLIFLIFYFFRKKRDTIMRLVRRRAMSLKQGVVDLWQLAFSYQVNPLAAVQPLPAPGNRSSAGQRLSSI